jgi:AcrR family transcriptional regulator
MARPQAFDLRDVTTAGLAVVADSGWSTVSVRSVAERLAVSPMALYRVVPDAQQLRRAIADAVAESLQPDPSADDLLGTLQAWARRAYTHLGCYPGLASFVIVEWTELPTWLDIIETLLGRADAEGISGDQAVTTVNAIYAYVLVRCQLRDSAAVAPRRQLAPVKHLRGRYPLIAVNIAEFTTAKTDRHFAFGLDVLTDGLRSDVADAACRTP